MTRNRIGLLIVFCSFCSLVVANEVPAASSQVSISLDSGLVALIKYGAPVVLALLIIYTGIGVAFWDGTCKRLETPFRRLENPSKRQRQKYLKN